MIHATQLTFIEPCSTVPGQGCDLNCLAVGLSMDFEVSFSPFHWMWFRAVLTWQTHHRLQLLFTVMKVSQRSGDRGDNYLTNIIAAFFYLCVTIFWIRSFRGKVHFYVRWAKFQGHLIVHPCRVDFKGDLVFEDLVL